MSLTFEERKRAEWLIEQRLLRWEAKSKLTETGAHKIRETLKQCCQGNATTQEIDTWRQQGIDYQYQLFTPNDRLRADSLLKGLLNKLVAEKYFDAASVTHLLRELNESIDQLQEQTGTKLHQAESTFVDSAPKTRKDEQKSLSLLERLLDPASLQRMMLAGGGLLVFGLILWLWTIGLFDNPRVMAGILGGINLGVIVTGVTLVMKSRFQLAGRALAMLGCLVMPLNLWFYDAQGLITLTNGGHLWIPALICCGCYALVARLLKDALFVHTFVGGIAMTGLLFLADHQVGRFFEILAPSTLLVLWGTICIHVERLFPVVGSDYRKENFGKAFFQSGHVTLASGLIILLAGRISGHFYDSFFADLGWFTRPDVVVSSQVQFLSLCLTIAGTWTYFWSYLGNAQSRRFLFASLLTLLWSEILLLDLLVVEWTAAVLLLVIGSTAWMSNRLAIMLPAIKADGPEHEMTKSIEGPFSLIGSVLTALAVCLGLFQFLLAVLGTTGSYWPNQFGWIHLLGLGAVFASVISAEKINNRSVKFFTNSRSVACLTLLLFLVEALLLTGLSWGWALLIVSFALGSVGCARQFWPTRWGTFSRPLLTVSAAAALSGGIADYLGLISGQWQPGLSELEFCLLSGWAGLLFAFVGRESGKTSCGLLSVLSIWISVNQFFLIFDLFEYVPILSASALGVIGLISSRYLLATTERDRKQGNIFESGSMFLFVFGSLAGLLLTLNRVVVFESDLSHLFLMLQQLGLTLVASVFSRQPKSRTLGRYLSVAHLAGAVLVFNVWLDLSSFQRLELLLILSGIGTLIAGYWGWSREDGRPHDLVTFQLISGSLLMSLPILAGLLEQRLFSQNHQLEWILFHELGALAMGMLLLGSGIICRIRSTTLAGAGTLFVYLVSLLTLIDLPERLQTVSVALMVGGAIFFVGSILLSIYRDYLLSFPNRIRQGEGVFRVLKWR